MMMADAVRLAAVIAGLSLATPVSAEVETLPLMPTCVSAPSFDAFVKTLKSVVRRRDTEGLLALAADDIQNRFPFEVGKNEMMLNWYLRDQGKKSAVWPTLKKMIKRRCAQDSEQRRWMDDGDDGGYFMVLEKRNRRWVITVLSGDAA
jgi:hypothetical protein